MWVWVGCDFGWAEGVRGSLGDGWLRVDWARSGVVYWQPRLSRCRPGGGIGRRATLRWWSRQRGGGSSPLSGIDRAASFGSPLGLFLGGSLSGCVRGRWVRAWRGGAVVGSVFTGRSAWCGLRRVAGLGGRGVWRELNLGPGGSDVSGGRVARRLGAVHGCHHKRKSAWSCATTRFSCVERSLGCFRATRVWRSSVKRRRGRRRCRFATS